MRALLLILLVATTSASAAEVAVIGASRELLSALHEASPEPKVTVVRGRPRTLRQALRAAGKAEYVLWIQVQGRAATAGLYAREGLRLGEVKARLSAGRWTDKGMAQVVELVGRVPTPPPAPAAALPAPAPAPEEAPPIAAASPVEPALEAPEPLPSAPAAAPARPPSRPIVAAAAPVEVLPTLAVLELPTLELGLGTEAVWRSYEFCPGSLQCGRQVFAGPSGLRFVTDAPYVGGTVTVTAFPLQEADPRLAGLGLEARYARRFLEVGMPDGSGTLTYQPSYDEEFWGELLYRQVVPVLGLTPWHGVRLGFGTRRFITGTGAAGTESVRQLGASLGLEGGLPLFARWLAVEAGLLYALGVSPGHAEREAHGGAVVGSDSLRLRGGLRGRSARAGLGYALMAEYGLFQDSFFGAGTRVEGGQAREEFLTFSASLHYAF